jgi:uncharacterized oligopeptide transporter (OPT) family protein
VGAAIILLDQELKSRGSQFRTPVLAVAVGIYLPLSLSVPIFFGGLIAHFTGRRMLAGASITGARFEQAVDTSKRHGLLLSAGLITGEAIVGILMAIPIVISKRRDVLALLDEPLGGWPGLILLFGVALVLYYVVVKSFRRFSE